MLVIFSSSVFVVRLRSLLRSFVLCIFALVVPVHTSIHKSILHTLFTYSFILHGKCKRKEEEKNKKINVVNIHIIWCSFVFILSRLFFIFSLPLSLSPALSLSSCCSFPERQTVELCILYMASYMCVVFLPVAI